MLNNKSRPIRAIKEHLEFFGIDTSNMTNEEIEDGILRMSKAAADYGYTTDEAANAMSSLQDKEID